MAHGILVLGASGGCGARVVEQALERGHRVTAMVRAGASYTPPAKVELVRGDVLDEAALAATLRGHDVVISCLGIRRRGPRNPWSRVLSPPDLVERVAHSLVAHARASGVSRVIAISAAGVGDSAPRMNAMMRFLVRYSKIGVGYRDLAKAETLFAASDLDWMAVRPVTLTAGRGTAACEVDRFGMTATISRRAVASWILDHLEGGPRTPMIARG